MKQISFIIISMLILAFPVHAQKKTGDEKFIEEHIEELSLEDLLGQKVSVASKEKTTIAEAPGIISVITKAELDTLGYENLYQVLSTIPGVEVMETYYGYTDLVFRGVIPYHYNNKVLLLIDGHPLEEPVNGSFYLKSIPICVIERIEIIRGPGSTLYGTNAFAGVINIVTISKIKKTKLSLKFRYGSFNNKMGSLFTQGKIGKHANFIMGSEFKIGENYTLPIDADMEGNSKNLEYRDNFFNSFFKFQYKKLQIHAFGSLIEKDKYGIIPTVISSGVSHYTNFGVMAKYTLNPTKKLEMRFKAWFDFLRKEELMGKMPPIQYYPGTLGLNEFPGERKYVIYTGMKQGYDGYAFYKLLPNLNLLAGLTYEYYIIKLTGTDEDIDVMDWSSLDNPYLTLSFLQPYIEANYSPFKFMKATAGVRANYSNVSGWNFVPRASLVFRIIKDLHLKLLYGQAYRVPTALELWVQAPDVIDGNTELLPEQVQQIEVGLDYKISGLALRLNGFYLSASNIIQRTGVVPKGEQRNTKDTKQYENSGKIQVWGFEFESIGNIINKGIVKLDLNINFSYKKGINNYFHRDIDFISPFLVNAGFNLTLWNRFFIYPMFQYSFRRSGYYIANLSKDAYGNTSSSVNSIYLLNLKAGFKISKNVSLSFIALNLLGDDIQYPDFVSNYAKNSINGYFEDKKMDIITIPGQPRTLYGEIDVKF